MKPIRHKSLSTGVILCLLLLMTLGGCMRSGITIVPVPNQNTLALRGDEIVQILSRAGLSPEQIKQYGWEVREALRTSGAARIMINKTVEAGFAVRGDQIYISTRDRGYWIYNINTGWVVPGR